MTEDQINSMKGWAEERDAITAILVPLRQQKESLLKDCADLRDANTVVTLAIERKKGNLEAMEEYEEERGKLISQELAGFVQKKTEQQLVLAGLENQIETKRKELDQIETSLNSLVPVYERVTWQINQLTETVHKVVTVNSENITQVNIMISDLRKALKEQPKIAPESKQIAFEKRKDATSKRAVFAKEEVSSEEVQERGKIFKKSIDNMLKIKQ